MSTKEQTIPKGYKHTEVGVIPSDWEIKKLDELVQINMGQSPGSASYNKTGEGIPLIQGNADIENRKSIQRVWTTQITKTCEPNDLIMTVRAPVGLIGIASEKSCLGRGVCSFKNLNVEKDFLFHSMIFNEVAWKILEQGSTFTAANSSQIKTFAIQVPNTKEEQAAIATALSDADALIEILTKLIEKKKNIKQGAMQELLTGKRRLPGFSGKWETKKLGEVCELKNGYAFKSSTYDDAGTYKIITIANVQDGYMDSNETNKIVALPLDVQEHQKLRTGDILISMTGNVGRVCFVNSNDSLLNQRVGKLVTFNIDRIFFFYICNSRAFLNTIIPKAVGGAQGNIGKADILEYEVTMPMEKEEQTAIATVLSDMDTEIERLESQLSKYQNLKQGMMQTLLTGKIRLI